MDAHALPHSGKLKIGGWRLHVQRFARTDLPADWRQASPGQAYLDADQVDGPLLTRPANGMCIAPLGMAGQTKLLGDLFTDEKIHPTLREGWPLFSIDGDGHILWVCGLRLGHGARITDNTDQVLALWWEKREPI